MQPVTAYSKEDIAGMYPVAESAGEEITSKYDLLVPYELFASDEEFEHWQGLNGKTLNRFTLSRISGVTGGGIKNYIDNVLRNVKPGEEANTVALVPYDFGQETIMANEAARLTARNIRFVPVKVRTILSMLPIDAKEEKVEEIQARLTFQKDAFAIMRLVRAVNVNTMQDKASPIYRMLQFYFKTHFDFGADVAGATMDEKIAVVIQMIVDGRDISKFIKVVLSYRPAMKRDAGEEYDRVTHVSIFA
jgi:hypothetical protein